jgi:hypothetical protein
MLEGERKGEDGERKAEAGCWRLEAGNWKEEGEGTDELQSSHSKFPPEFIEKPVLWMKTETRRLSS